MTVICTGLIFGANLVQADWCGAAAYCPTGSTMGSLTKVTGCTKGVSYCIETTSNTYSATCGGDDCTLQSFCVGSCEKVYDPTYPTVWTGCQRVDNRCSVDCCVSDGGSTGGGGGVTCR